jgi:uncharacterized protein
MEYFVLPYIDLFVIYSPLKRLAFLVNGTVIDTLKRRESVPVFTGISHDSKQIIEFLDATGIFDTSDPMDLMPYTLEFKPTSATLFLSNMCNLRCIYCYASAGDRSPVVMPWEIANAAIDYIINNALEIGEKTVQIGFHGGGEPTLAWSLMKQIVSYFKKAALQNNLTPSVHAATNGVVPQSRLNWIIDNLTSVNISLDGLPDIQNIQRPMASGAPSFDAVWSMIKIMDIKQFPYGIRATVTNRSVSEMGRFTKYLIDNSHCRQIHFEPTFSCGRCATTGVNSPSSEDFIEGFRTASALAEGHSIELYYSGARLHTVTDKFCHAAGEGFSISPTGDITSCYEVITDEDRRSRTFFYGKYDNDKRKFVIFPDKLRQLQEWTVAKLEYCRNCFCKYHCAGDCLTRSTNGIDLSTVTDNSRCKINQTLTFDQIIQNLSVDSESQGVNL